MDPLPPPLKVFIGCPGDMADERAELLKLRDHLDHIRCPVTFLVWKNCPPGAGDAQKVIFDNYPIDTWDVFLGLLWTRFGVPSGIKDPISGEMLTGTEAEFVGAYEAFVKSGQKRPHILLYRCRRDFPNDIDTAQLDGVRKFFEQTLAGAPHAALTQDFKTVEELKVRVVGDLAQIAPRVRQAISTTPVAQTPLPAPATPVAQTTPAPHRRSDGAFPLTGWIILAAICVSLVLSLVVMRELEVARRNSAQAFLSTQGITWTASDWKAKVPAKTTSGTLMSANESLKQLGCKELVLAGCMDLQDIDGIRGLDSLQVLNLRGCSNLSSIEGIRGLKSLTYIFFSKCVKLEDIEPLKGLDHLQEIDFSGCNNVKNFEVLGSLKSLRFVFVEGLDPAQIKKIRDLAPQASPVDGKGRTIKEP